MQLPYLPQPGRPIEAAWAKQVIACLKALTWQSTPSLKVTTGPGGTTGTVVQRVIQSAPGSGSHPFKCTLIPQTNPNGTPAGNKVAVEYLSALYKSRVPLEQYSGIIGLNDPENPFALELDGPDDTTNYTSLDGPDDYVILEVQFAADGFKIDSVKIDTNGNGSTVDPTYDAWDDSGDALLAWTKNSQDQYVQNYARVVLATYEDGKLQQNVFGNLVLEDVIVQGASAVYPVAY